MKILFVKFIKGGSSYPNKTVTRKNRTESIKGVKVKKKLH